MAKNNSSGEGGQKGSREFYELGRKYAEESLGVPEPGALTRQPSKGGAWWTNTSEKAVSYTHLTLPTTPYV